MFMEFQRVMVGWGQANCYILYPRDGDECLLIDPGGGEELIEKRLEELGKNPVAVLCTHGHADHIGALAWAKNKECSIYIHADDASYLTTPEENLSCYIPDVELIHGPPADELLQGGEKLSLAHLEIQVLHTPGHTPGGVCYLIGEHLFSGDTLFQGSVGRTDLPGGSGVQLAKSLEKLMDLPGEIMVHPGHGASTSIEQERRDNPFCRRS
ncbi:MAG: MBL fold metallo-hydrolase [Limnochordia bacterium]|jgi:hydroxyacylglutathione hydrolase